MPVKLDRRVLDALRASGHPWWVAEGKKHHKLFVAGRLACVFSRSSKADTARDVQNNIRSIRRVCREMENSNV